ncbi:MAG: aldehyde-activating protein [Gammaproteobacteria bacterium]|nr:MAG: aldehyde-activating protein [Gammaproteobacteria bacterium]RLA16660.1 MAG: aldehyde-activating protein [Gammaproteobacteria bacterium]
MQRSASCSCGQLTINVSGEPGFVVACNCLKCQKRTGSVFGVSAYFEDTQVDSVTGNATLFEKVSDSGNLSKRHFCPECGTTVYWQGASLPDKTGIAVGCFSDPNFPEPEMVVWTSSKHGWVTYPDAWLSSDTQEFDRSS